jgi:hypothetical protein
MLSDDGGIRIVDFLPFSKSPYQIYDKIKKNHFLIIIMQTLSALSFYSYFNCQEYKFELFPNYFTKIM